MEELSSLELTEFQLEHISSQQRKYDSRTYNIDWDEVKTGKAAGMPGGWVSQKILYCIIIYSCKFSSGPFLGLFSLIHTFLHIPYLF